MMTSDVMITANETSLRVSISTTSESQSPVMSATAYYCNYVFLIFGTLCNIAAVCCLCKTDTPKDKNNTVRYYLIPLAICDGFTIFFFHLEVILRGLSTPVYIHWETGCNIYALAAFAIGTSELSSLLVVMITLNRFVALFFPMKFKQLQSINRIYYCIGVLILVVIIINWNSFGGMKPVDRKQLDQIKFFVFHCRGCTHVVDNYYFNIFPIIDLAVYFIIPALVLFVCNIAIVIKLRHRTRVRPAYHVNTNSTVLPHHQAPCTITIRRQNVFTVTPMSNQPQIIATSPSLAIPGTSQTATNQFQSRLTRQGQRMTRICLILSISCLVQFLPNFTLQIMILMNIADAADEKVDILYD